MDAQTSGFVINFWSLWKGICIVAMAETLFFFFFLIRMAETIKLEGGYGSANEKRLIKQSSILIDESN